MSRYVYDEKFKEVIELYKKKTQKECYKVISIDKRPTILDDKIGGIPYIPINEEWPKGKNGKPLSLLLQVNLKNIDLKGFPKTGILEIFTDSPLHWPCEYIIKVFEEGLEYKKNLKNPDIKKDEEEQECLLVQAPSKIKLEKAIDYMPRGHIGCRKLFIEIVNKVYGQNLSTFNDVGEFFANYKGYDFGEYAEYDWEDAVFEDIDYNSITIGGYANFTQTDIRLDEPKHKNKTECIFKLDSIANYKRYHIGDSGIIFALISKSDLKNANFDKALIDWDCC